MSTKLAPFVLLAAVLGAAGFAAFSAEGAHPASQAPPAQASGPVAVGEAHDDALPANHPPIGASMQGAPLPESDEGPAIAWEVPAGWETIPNPSTMRIGTYLVKAGSRPPAEVSVVRAGGTTEANIQRWLGQFDDAGQETRTVRTVHGFKITIVEVSGTFLGGSMTPDAPNVPHRGWALLGAIVETPDSPYFFKLTGDAATVRAARASFDALLGSITPS